MEFFDQHGHLTDEALRALTENAPMDELSRLEVAEHLAFCDQCLQRYTLYLAGQPTLVPAHSCQESLWRRIRQRSIRLITSRYATAAAADGALGQCPAACLRTAAVLRAGCPHLPALCRLVPALEIFHQRSSLPVRRLLRSLSRPGLPGHPRR